MATSGAGVSVDLSQLLKATRGTVAPVSEALLPNVGAGSTRRSLRLQIAARRTCGPTSADVTVRVPPRSGRP